MIYNFEKSFNYYNLMINKDIKKYQNQIAEDIIGDFEMKKTQKEYKMINHKLTKENKSLNNTVFELNEKIEKMNFEMDNMKKMMNK